MNLLRCLHCGCVDERDRFFPLDRDEIWQEIEDLYDSGRMDDFGLEAMVLGNDIPGCPECGMRGEVEEVEDENFKQPLWVNPFFGREDDELDD